jgi:hypothetical protein
MFLAIQFPETATEHEQRAVQNSSCAMQLPVRRRDASLCWGLRVAGAHATLARPPRHVPLFRSKASWLGVRRRRPGIGSGSLRSLASNSTTQLRMVPTAADQKSRGGHLVSGDPLPRSCRTLCFLFLSCPPWPLPVEARGDWKRRERTHGG